MERQGFLENVRRMCDALLHGRLECAIVVILQKRTILGVRAVVDDELRTLTRANAAEIRNALLRPPLRAEKQREAALHTPDRRNQR